MDALLIRLAQHPENSFTAAEARQLKIWVNLRMIVVMGWDRMAMVMISQCNKTTNIALYQ